MLRGGGGGWGLGGGVGWWAGVGCVTGAEGGARRGAERGGGGRCSRGRVAYANPQRPLCCRLSDRLGACAFLLPRSLFLLVWPPRRHRLVLPTHPRPPQRFPPGATTRTPPRTSPRRLVASPGATAIAQTLAACLQRCPDEDHAHRLIMRAGAGGGRAPRFAASQPASPCHRRGYPGPSTPGTPYPHKVHYRKPFDAARLATTPTSPPGDAPHPHANRHSRPTTPVPTAPLSTHSLSVSHHRRTPLIPPPSPPPFPPPAGAS